MLTEAPYNVTIPQETVNDETVRIISWKAMSGTFVVKDQPLCEIETSKVVIDMQAPISGILHYGFSAGDEISVGSTLCSITPEQAAHTNGKTSLTIPEPRDFMATPALALESPSGSAAQSPFPSRIESLAPARLTPSARKTATEYQVEISAFPAGSLVRKNDVLRMAGVHVEDSPVPPKIRQQNRQRADRSPAPAAASAGVPVQWRSLLRRKIIEGKILAAGRTEAVQSAVTVRVNAPLLRARARELYASDVTFDALILFEASRLLLQFPQLNAVHDDGRIGEYGEINICWAIDSGNHLVAPVVRNCDQKSLAEIASTMERQLESYLDNRLGPEELRGGTFSVSDLSRDGICFFSPLISQGQAAILGISSDKSMAQEEILYLTLGFDHQLAEGRSAARFLTELASRLEAHNRVQSLKVSRPRSTQASQADAYCVVCQRDYGLLQKSRAVLVRSEFPPGLVCSLCIGGF